MVITFDAIWCLKHRGQFEKANRSFGICIKYETCVSVVTNFGMDRAEKIRVCRRGRLIKKYEYKEDGLIPLGPHVLFAFSIYLLRQQQQQPFESLRSYCRIWGRNHFPFNTLFPPAAFGSDRLDNNNQTLTNILFNIPMPSTIASLLGQSICHTVTDQHYCCFWPIAARPMGKFTPKETWEGRVYLKTLSWLKADEVDWVKDDKY